MDELLDWAITQGVELNGVAPKRFPGRGIGVVATRAIQPGDVILEVPMDCLRTISTVPKSIVRKLPNITVHGLFATDLALDTGTKYGPWDAVCPRPQDFITMPMLWPAELQELLPGPARENLRKQQAKFRQDWSAVSSAFPDLTEADYQYSWILVNTRTFYYLDAKLKKKPKEDHMCMQPVADLFNHGDEGCNVAFDQTGFTFKATGAYAEGDEVKICYGRHGGDSLLVEYGFVMDENRWDEVGLDDILLRKLNTKQKEQLEEVGFLGKYVLDRDTVCYRTQVALRLLCRGVREWRRFVNGIDDGESSQGEADSLLGQLLCKYREEIVSTIQKIEMMEVGEPEQRHVLVKRWRQIQDMVNLKITQLEGSHPN
ncbi:SET domain-containing protein [Xylariomycetidae sp. FL2044]|nr:SET domain-containing protein [Xylariomycetidae sp. FL2044]